jgi:hypothetical protein
MMDKFEDRSFRSRARVQAAGRQAVIKPINPSLWFYLAPPFAGVISLASMIVYLISQMH